MSSEPLGTPGEWHPWYADKRATIEPWLESDSFEPLRLPVPPKVQFLAASEPVAFDQMFVELRKHVAYLGPEVPESRLMNPGIQWHVGIDQYGRQVHGKPRTAPLPKKLR